MRRFCFILIVFSIQLNAKTRSESSAMPQAQQWSKDQRSDASSDSNSKVLELADQLFAPEGSEAKRPPAQPETAGAKD